MIHPSLFVITCMNKTVENFDFMIWSEKLIVNIPCNWTSRVICCFHIMGMKEGAIWKTKQREKNLANGECSLHLFYISLIDHRTFGHWTFGHWTFGHRIFGHRIFGHKTFGHKTFGHTDIWSHFNGGTSGRIVIWAVLNILISSLVENSSAFPLLQTSSETANTVCSVNCY